MASKFDDTIIFLYESILGRIADPVGFQYWSNYVGDDASKLGDVVTAFMNSEEIANRDESAVSRLYASVFGRLPDKGGYEYWSNALKTDQLSLQQIADSFITSDEFISRFGSNPSSAELVTNMYLNTLGRLPDDQGKAYWISLLENGIITTSELLLNFTQSPEAIDLMQSRVDVIYLHHKLLDRMPTALEFASATDTNTLTTTLVANSSYIGPNPDQPTSTLTATLDEDSVFEISGSLAGQLIVNQKQNVMTEAGFDIAPEGVDWTTFTTLDLSQLTNNIVNVVLADAGATVIAGSTLQSLIGGSGADTLVVNGAITPGGEGIQLGEGEDILQLASATNLSLSELFGGVETITGSTGDDTIQVSAAQSSTLNIDGGTGADTLQFSEAGTYNLAALTNITNVESFTGSTGDDTIQVSAAQSSTLNIDGGDGTDTLQFSEAGTYNLAALTNITNVERFVGSGSGSFELLGTENDEYLVGGSGSNRYLGLAGADIITLGSGIDIVAYTALTESQIPASDASTFRGDVINGFEIGTDLIELPALPVGNLTIGITIPFAFLSTFASTLTASQALTTALSGADDDAAYVTVTDGNAAGDYLIVQGTASTAGFDPASDLIVKLENVDDTVSLTGASTISDLFVA